MSRKTTDQKTEKQTETEKPVALRDDELDKVQGGMKLGDVLKRR